MARIHPTAIIDPRSNIAADVSLGPYCVIEPDTTIGEGCHLASHIAVKSGTTLGKRNQIFEGAVLGGIPQHVKVDRHAGHLKIGDGNIIREHVTINTGLGESDCTVVGNNNMIMVNAHIAHDCCVGDHTIIVNNAMIAGHVTIESRAYVSGAVGIHQFCRVGQLAMVGGQAHISQDVPPFVTIDGLSSEVVGLNRIGLRRNGYTVEDIRQLKEAYRIIYRAALPFDEILTTLRQEFPTGPAAAFHGFLAECKRGFLRERRIPPKATIRIFSGEESDDSSSSVRHAS